MIATTQTWTISFCFVSSIRCLHGFHGFFYCFILAFAKKLIICCFDVCRFFLFCANIGIHLLVLFFLYGTCVCMITTLK
jgi:hypothetical protein